MWTSVITSHSIVKEKYVCCLPPVKRPAWMTLHLYQGKGSANIPNQVSFFILHFVTADTLNGFQVMSW